MRRERWFARALGGASAWVARVAWVASVASIASVEPAEATTVIRLLGEATVPREAPGVTSPIGGLSGWTYDPETESYYVISDDRSQFAPARFYRLTVDLDDGRLEDGDIKVLGQAVLRQADGEPFPFDVIDPEGIARGPAGTWWIASEGNADAELPVTLAEFTAEGLLLGELALPKAYRPGRKNAGVRHNLGFESATVSPDGRWLFTALENALKQDGPRATPAHGSRSRLLRFDLGRLDLESSYLYRTEPIARAPEGAAFAVNGLVDLLALSEDRLLALERSFTVGHGNVARLFEIDLEAATDVTGMRSLARRSALVAASKRLLLDVGALGIEPDNLEGMTFGPMLPNGDRTLLLIADDNFNPGLQRSQVLALALGDEPMGIADLVGPGRRAALRGAWVRGVVGIVVPAPVEVDSRTVRLRDDRDTATSPVTLRVRLPSGSKVEAGDRMSLQGVVVDGESGSQEWVLEVSEFDDSGPASRPR